MCLFLVLGGCNCVSSFLWGCIVSLLGFFRFSIHKYPNDDVFLSKWVTQIVQTHTCASHIPHIIPQSIPPPTCTRQSTTTTLFIIRVHIISRTTTTPHRLKWTDASLNNQRSSSSDSVLYTSDWYTSTVEQLYHRYSLNGWWWTFVSIAMTLKITCQGNIHLDNDSTFYYVLRVQYHSREFKG